MAKQGSKMWVLIVGAIVVAAMVLGPPALKSLGETWSDFWADFWAPFLDDDGADNDNNGNLTLSGLTGVGLKIYYTDGSTEDFKPSLSIIPLTIYSNERAVSKVEGYLTLTVDYEGSLANWEMVANCQLKITSVPEPREYSNLVYSQANKGALADNTPLQFVFMRYDAAFLENELSGKPYGDYQLTITMHDTSLKLTGEDGSTAEETGLSASCVWNFKYGAAAGSIQIVSVSITLQAGPIYA